MSKNNKNKAKSPTPNSANSHLTQFFYSINKIKKAKKKFIEQTQIAIDELEKEKKLFEQLLGDSETKSYER